MEYEITRVNLNVTQKNAEFENDEVIICEDWNFVINPELDMENYVHVNNPNARRIILNYVEEENRPDWTIFLSVKVCFSMSQKQI